jgi:hypothetical protein
MNAGVSRGSLYWATADVGVSAVVDISGIEDNDKAQAARRKYEQLLQLIDQTAAELHVAQDENERAEVELERMMHVNQRIESDSQRVASDNQRVLTENQRLKDDLARLRRDMAARSTRFAALRRSVEAANMPGIVRTFLRQAMNGEVLTDKTHDPNLKAFLKSILIPEDMKAAFAELTQLRNDFAHPRCVTVRKFCDELMERVTALTDAERTAAVVRGGTATLETMSNYLTGLLHDWDREQKDAAAAAAAATGEDPVAARVKRFSSGRRRSRSQS